MGSSCAADGRGRELGVPTANLQDQKRAHACEWNLRDPGGWQGVASAVTSVGVRPTIGDGQFTVETFLLDGPHELYGEPLTVAFVKWLRAERKFDDAGPGRPDG
jgi:riboflavin kinase/FMN adenylyltransferase